MPRTDFHLKVVVDHDQQDNLEKLGKELCRQLEKVYGVRSAEVSNSVTQRPGE